MNEKSNLDVPATADLGGSLHPGEVAKREGWEPNEWAVAMGHRIRNLARPLDAQRERLLALRDSGLNADQASTEALGQHFVMLEALFQRLASEAMRTVENGGYRSEERTEGLLRAALKAQRAAVACLSAMKALRDSPTPTTPAKTLGARASASA